SAWPWACCRRCAPCASTSSMHWPDARSGAMHKLKRFFGTLLVLLLLVLALVAWVMLPWQGVLGVAVLLAAWLLLARRGRQALAVAGVGISTLAQRWAASAVIVVGIAGVVAVLVAMLAMAAGFEATLNRTGNDQTAIILRGGSMAETNSVISRDQVPLVAQLPGIARGSDGQPLASAEMSQVINLPTRADGTDANAQLRGVGAAAWEL